MRKHLVLATLITATVVFPIGWFLGDSFGITFLSNQKSIMTPLIDQIQEKKLPLLKYTISNLTKYKFQPSLISVDKILTGNSDFISYLFSYQTLGKNMSGQLNIPTSPQPEKGYPVVVLLRGWVPADSYQTGTGTKSAAAVFAKNGYVTLAPDFFGYGQSDSEVEDSWEARFQKPMNVVELFETINKNPQIKINGGEISLSTCECDKYIWAHSNGGQIALTALEIYQRPIKTTLWAPVTAPFPYSVLFYSDEHEDEGKEARAWLSIFEENYDAFDFSITKNIDKLSGAIQIHQGTNDDAVPLAWNDEFVAKIDRENEKRLEALEQDKDASPTAKNLNLLPPIKINYYKYPGADHNLQPDWNKAIQRDLEFFKKIEN